MIRSEYLKRLESLLSDIDEKDREDALTYYRDYMDDAGIGDSDLVDGLLDAPEVIARMIKGGTPEETVISDAPAVYETLAEKDDERRYDQTDDPTVKHSNHIGKLILIIAIVVVGFPVIAGTGSAVISLIFGIIIAILGVAFGSAVACAGCAFGGIVLFVKGMIVCVTAIPTGILLIGVALCLIALSIFMGLLTKVIFTKLFPWFFHGISTVFHRLSGQKGGRTA